MYKLLLILMVLGFQFTLVACTTKGVALLSPLTETERQGLGTIGVMVRLSGSEVWYSRPPFFVDSELREMQDRLYNSGQGDLEGDKQAKTVKEFEGFKCRNQGCLLAVPLYLGDKSLHEALTEATEPLTGQSIQTHC